jgi:hypothetical protein
VLAVAATGDQMQRRLTSRPHQWRLMLAAAGVLVLAGAFLLWGPIGLGNGPLGVQMGATQGGSDPTTGPVVISIPLYNTGHGLAVVDAVDLIGRTRYPGPRVLRLEIVAEVCLGAWPTRPASRSAVAERCSRDKGSLIGHAIGAMHGISAGFPGAAEIAAPPARSCWVMTEVVVHYHVGIRHYAATSPYDMVVCAANAARQQVNGASRAAGS